MRKKEANSLFLDYLVENEAEFESQADTWLEGVQEKDGKSLDELSSSLNERVILQEACFGELGWCFPNFMKQHIKLGNVMADLRKKVSVDEIDLGIAECFIEREIEAIVSTDAPPTFQMPVSCPSSAGTPSLGHNFDGR